MEDTSKILKWCAYDSDFTPNQHDDRFKNWTLKGLTDYYSFVYKGAIQSFESLQRKHGLDSAEFFRYLQIRHYFNQELKVNLNDLGFVGTFISLVTNSGAHIKIISRLYNSILKGKKDNTHYVKEKWEKEGKLIITEECWEHVCEIQWATTGSNVWREFCWKNIMRFFITPVQKRYRGNGDACWRCGGGGANHFHIFWDCKVISQYWSRIHEHIQNIFAFVFPLAFDTLYLCNISSDKMDSKDKKLLYILLAASKKALTRRWLKPEPPTTEDWINIVYEIYIMEKLSFSLKVQRDTFYKMWSKWTEYVKPVRSDFL